MKSKSPKRKVNDTIPKVSYYRKPKDMGIDEYQILLRKQYAETQKFEIRKLSPEQVYADYNVQQQGSKQWHRVALRHPNPGLNFCTCLDFKTNQLGTCKHIEYVWVYLKEKKIPVKQIANVPVPIHSSLYIKYGATRQVMLRIGSTNTEKLIQWKNKYFDRNQILDEQHFENIDSIIKEAQTIDENFRCNDDALAFILQQRDDVLRKKKIEALPQNSIFKKLIKVSLFPYQLEGALFAARAGRSLIADEMGLGKTIQALAAAELLRHINGINSVLIICPTSLKYQWLSEIEKFTKSQASVIEGPMHVRAGQYRNQSFYKIASYNAAGNDHKLINHERFDLIILDEAQRIKNWRTKISYSIKQLQSKHIIVLTGTPLENRIEELYSVVQVIDQFRLGPLYRLLHNHQHIDESTNKVVGYKDLHKLGTLLSEFTIRRNKSVVSNQLPERMVKTLFVPMTQAQRDLHNSFQADVSQIVNRWKRKGFLTEEERQKLMILMGQMRMVCDSTYIIDQETRHDTKVEELMNILEEAIFETDQKAVVFSQWERMTRLVAQELDARGIEYEYLHGGIASKNRKDLLEHFRNKRSSKIFLSTDAGGVGLNLQSASLLVNLDLPWNPAVLEQRIARVHRMGQQRKVQIINMVSMDTIESQMIAKLEFKQAMAKGILDKGQDVIFMDESSFTKFMQLVESTMPPPSSEDSTNTATVTQSDVAQEIATERETFTSSKVDNPTNRQMALPFESAEGNPPADVSVPDFQPEEIVKAGAAFFEKLQLVIHKENGLQMLVKSITKRDETTGQTYLNLPVQSEESVAGFLKMLAAMMNK
ncbi:MAG: DEAD/DEAH box helicase [Bacteroidetes bacterium]|nr:DEAD/DEAH box helicase [Bacteroidota bacterium]